jgi:hypothetical protein
VIVIVRLVHKLRVGIPHVVAANDLVRRVEPTLVVGSQHRAVVLDDGFCIKAQVVVERRGAVVKPEDLVLGIVNGVVVDEDVGRGIVHSNRDRGPGIWVSGEEIIDDVLLDGDVLNRAIFDVNACRAVVDGVILDTDVLGVVVEVDCWPKQVSATTASGVAGPEPIHRVVPDDGLVRPNVLNVDGVLAALADRRVERAILDGEGIVRVGVEHLDAVAVAVIDYCVSHGETRCPSGQDAVGVLVVSLKVLIDGTASDSAIITAHPDKLVVGAIVNRAVLDSHEITIDVNGIAPQVFLVKLEVLDGNVVARDVEGVVPSTALPAHLRARRRGDGDAVRQGPVDGEVNFPLVVVTRRQRIPDDVESIAGCGRCEEIRL